MKINTLFSGKQLDVPLQLLTPANMAMADKLTIESGLFSSYALMLRAGAGVVDVVLQQYSNVKKIAVLCGPGNNGGDAYVVAEMLSRHGFSVTCYASKAPNHLSDAELAFHSWTGVTLALEKLNIAVYDLVIDGLFGAGLDRKLDNVVIRKIKDISKAHKPVIAIDLPSGISGATGEILGIAPKAAHTVTFFRLKPGHVLYPGRDYCGQIHVVDIGIPDHVIDLIPQPSITINHPNLWKSAFHIDMNAHKYSRGHCAVFSGPELMTGASRLSAQAAAKIGAGAVTVIGDRAALRIHATHLTSIMLHKYETESQIADFIQTRKVKSVVVGPGFYDKEKARRLIEVLLKIQSLPSLVIDADGITAFEGHAELLWSLIHHSKTQVVMTPHEGEFARIFPELTQGKSSSRIEKAKFAAEKSGAVVIYKGADTIVADPDGSITININGTPYLATAGSGDVLSGIVAGLLAQSLPKYMASTAGVFIHSQCAQIFGAGLIAEDLVATIGSVMKELNVPMTG